LVGESIWLAALVGVGFAGAGHILVPKDLGLKTSKASSRKA